MVGVPPLVCTTCYIYSKHANKCKRRVYEPTPPTRHVRMIPTTVTRFHYVKSGFLSIWGHMSIPFYSLAWQHVCLWGSFFGIYDWQNSQSSSNVYFMLSVGGLIHLVSGVIFFGVTCIQKCRSFWRQYFWRQWWGPFLIHSLSPSIAFPEWVMGLWAGSTSQSTRFLSVTFAQFLW